MSKARLDRIDYVLKILEKIGGRATCQYLKDLIVRHTQVSFVTAERYIEEMKAMNKIKADGAFWVLAKDSGEA